MTQMLTKLNIWSIISDHFQTLKKYKGKGYSKSDILAFYGLPILVASLLIFWFSVSDEVANALITSLSVFAGLLLNLLLLVFDTLRKEEAKEDKVRQQVLKETYSNISYAILISLLCIILLVGFAIWDGGFSGTWVTVLKIVASWIVYFLTINFLLTLLMILKRVHILMSLEYD
ncbi:MAG: hypothetical protein R3A44_38475 [Caldilineaceae bacterium]